MKSFSKKHKDKLKENHKGMLGKKHTIETKAKLNECMMGRFRDEETKLKISESNKGRQFTDEHKNKLSKSHIGKKLFTHTKETKEKSSNSLKGKHLSNDHIKKLRILKIIEIEKNKLNGNQLYPNFNQDVRQKEIQSHLNCKFIRIKI